MTETPISSLAADMRGPCAPTSHAYRVLHVQKVAGIAGSENHLLDLLPAQRALGLRPEMLVLVGPGDRPEAFIAAMENAGVATRTLRIHGHVDPLGLLRLRKLVREGAYDLVHTHLFHADIYGAAAASFLPQVRLVSTKHGFNPWRSKRFYGLLDRLAALRQDRMITISSAIGKWLKDTERLPAQKMVVVHYGLDARAFRARGAEDADLTMEVPVIGCISRFLEQKGVHVLLEAFAQTCAEGTAGSLILVGDGPERARLERLANDLRVANRVHFLGYRSNVSSVVREFDILAFPTFGEGFGLVLLEAMAWSKAVVASNVMSIPEIVLDGETGLLVAPGDVESLARAIRQLLQDPQRTSQMGERGCRRLEEHFTVEAMTYKTTEVYRKIISERANVK